MINSKRSTDPGNGGRLGAVARDPIARIRLAVPLGLLLLGLAACVPAPSPDTAPPQVTSPSAAADLDETPVPDGSWRPHRLARCREDIDVPAEVERLLGLCSEFFREGSGSDGMIEMELALAAGSRHSLMLMTLAQLYIMAGQGEPALLPVEGPAADVGDWDRNRRRLLARARDLLAEAAPSRPDDATVDYLLADAARTAGEFDEAERLVASARGKCTGGRGFSILQLYQSLNRYPPRYLGGPSPEYPATAARDGVAGAVVLDLLLAPNGEVRQFVVVSSPAETLTRAAESSLRRGRFEAARLGKYDIWSWLRVTTAFNLSSD